MKLEPTLIVYEIRSALGDTLVNLPAIYLINKMFPKTKIIIITNTTGAKIYSRFSFYDELINLEFARGGVTDISDWKDKINAELGLHQESLWILCNRTSAHIKEALSFPVSHVITFSHLRSFYEKRLICPLWFQRNGRHEIFHYLKLLEKVNSAKYKDSLKNFNLQEIVLKGSKQNAINVENYFNKINCQNYKKIIGINPFAKSQTKDGVNFSLSVYCKVINALAKKFPNVLFVTMSFEKNKQNKELEEQIQNYRNLTIWYGDDDLYNLVEFVRRLDLLISPGTGCVHVADNVGTNNFSMYMKLYKYRWSSNGFLQLKNKISKLNPNINNDVKIGDFGGILLTPENLSKYEKELLKILENRINQLITKNK